MVLAFSWVSSGRPAWRVRWSNQGTVARPSRASAHSAQAATPAHRWDPARGAAAVTAIVLTSYRRLLPATGIRDQCRWLPSQERYGQRPVQKADLAAGSGAVGPPSGRAGRAVADDLVVGGARDGLEQDSVAVNVEQVGVDLHGDQVTSPAGPQPDFWPATVAMPTLIRRVTRSGARPGAGRSPPRKPAYWLRSPRSGGITCSPCWGAACASAGWLGFAAGAFTSTAACCKWSRPASR